MGSHCSDGGDRRDAALDGAAAPDSSVDAALDAGADGSVETDAAADGRECDPEAWPDLPGWSEEGVDYTACPEAELYFGDDCADDACADSPEAIELLRAFRDAIEDRGFADRIEILSVQHVPGLYRLDYVVVVDWWRCPAVIYEDDSDLRPAEHVADQLPDEVPENVPSWSEVLTSLRECDPESQPAPCRGGACNHIEGTAGECGQALVWWSNGPDGPHAECQASSGAECCDSGG